MSDVLSLQAHLAVPPSTVYRALTDEAALRTWLAEHAEVSLPEKRFQFWGWSTPQGERGHHALLDAEQDAMLRFTWTLDAKTTTVDIELQADEDGNAILRLHQDGLPTLEELMAPAGRRDGLHTMHTFWGLALSNLAAYVEGRPLTPKADFRPDRAGEIRVRLEIDAPQDVVFASLIDPKQVERWFGWKVEIEPHLGGSITLGAQGKIFEFEQGKSLAYSDSDGSIVRWELEGSDGKTYLTFVQSGYTDDEWDNAAQHEAGWLSSLAELKRMHELGDDWAPLTSELPIGTGGHDEQD